MVAHLQDPVLATMGGGSGSTHNFVPNKKQVNNSVDDAALLAKEDHL